MNRRDLLKAMATAPIIGAPNIARAGYIYGRKPWVPTDLGTQLVAWWRAQDYTLMVDDGSGLISSWKDYIGGLTVTATTTARPTWSATSFNSSYPGLTFDGSANCFVATSFGALPTGSTAGEIWCVATQTVAQIGYVCSYGGTAGGTLRRAGVNATFHPNGGDGTTALADSGTNLVSSPAIWGIQFSGTTANGWINGTAFNSNPTTIGSLNTLTTRLRIGSNNGSSAASFFGGVGSDILVVSPTLSTANRQNLEGYFAWARGMQTASNSFLPASQPYRYAPP